MIETLNIETDTKWPYALQSYKANSRKEEKKNLTGVILNVSNEQIGKKIYKNSEESKKEAKLLDTLLVDFVWYVRILCLVVEMEHTNRKRLGKNKEEICCELCLYIVLGTLTVEMP